MLRSMNSAISGMQAFQTDLDVVGNNIANVNTIGYKTGRADFADIFSQTVQGATQSTASTQGGQNAEQVGLGTKIGAINNLFTQGASETTGVATDLDITGQGMFCVSPNPGGGSLYYTRAGDFTVDATGNLVLPNAMIAVGYQGATKPTMSGTPASAAKPTTAINIPTLETAAGGTYPANAQVNIGKDGSVNVVDTSGTNHILGYIGMATFSNYGGLEKMGDSIYQQSANSGTPAYQVADENTISIQSGALEMSNVDLTKEFSEMIVAQNAYAANSKMIGTDNAILQALVNMKNG